MKLLFENWREYVNEEGEKGESSFDWEKMREWLKENFPQNWKEVERNIIIPALSAAAVIHPIVQPEYYFEEKQNKNE